MSHSDDSRPLPRVSLVLDEEKRELLTVILTPDRNHPLRLGWEVVVKPDYVTGDELPAPFKPNSIGQKFRVAILGTAFGNGVYVLKAGLMLTRKRVIDRGFTAYPTPYLLMAVARNVPPAEYAVRAEAAIAAGVASLPNPLEFDVTLALVQPGQYEVPQPLPK